MLIKSNRFAVAETHERSWPSCLQLLTYICGFTTKVFPLTNNRSLYFIFNLPHNLLFKGTDPCYVCWGSSRNSLFLLLRERWKEFFNSTGSFSFHSSPTVVLTGASGLPASFSTTVHRAPPCGWTAVLSDNYRDTNNTPVSPSCSHQRSPQFTLHPDTGATHRFTPQPVTPSFLLEVLRGLIVSAVTCRFYNVGKPAA